jgi:hypothetical protein
MSKVQVSRRANTFAQGWDDGALFGVKHSPGWGVRTWDVRRAMLAAYNRGSWGFPLLSS